MSEPNPRQSPSHPAVRVKRPHRNLLLYYALLSLLTGPFFPIVLVPLFFKYETLRYTFDEQGVTQRWGILFRREISLNYTRIQDIHLASNFVERWLGLGRVLIQTASGASGAEMTIEGLQEFEEVRDDLYSRTRGARRRKVERARPAGSAAAPAGAIPGERDLVAALDAIAEELAAVRRLLERQQPPPRRPPTGPPEILS